MIYVYIYIDYSRKLLITITITIYTCDHMWYVYIYILNTPFGQISTCLAIPLRELQHHWFRSSWQGDLDVTRKQDIGSRVEGSCQTLWLVCFKIWLLNLLILGTLGSNLLHKSWTDPIRYRPRSSSADQRTFWETTKIPIHSSCLSVNYGTDMTLV